MDKKLKVKPGTRPSEDEIKIFELKMSQFKEDSPTSVKFKDHYKVDRGLLIEINDRLLGPNGNKYIEALQELNNKTDENGNLLFPKIESKYGHDIWKEN